MRLCFRAVPILVASTASCGSRTALEVDSAALSIDAGTDAIAPLSCTVGAPPVAIASHLAGPRGLALLKDAVIVAVASDSPSMPPQSGALVRIPKGGGPFAILLRGQDGPRDVVADDVGIYWLNDGDGMVRSASLDFTTTRVLAIGFVGAQGLAVDATDVFWGNAHGGNVMKVAKNANGTAAIPIPLAQATDTPALTLDATRVYYVHRSQQTVESVGKGGDEPRVDVLATDTIGVTLDDSHLYFSSIERQRQVLALPFAGGAPVRIAFAMGTIGPIAIDRDYVYWSEGSAGAYSIRRAAKRGSDPETLATSAVAPGALAVDDQCVYWDETSADASIMKVAKSLR